MKRIIYSLVAIVSLFAVSCVQEDTSVTQPIGSEALVSISVENSSASRAIAQGEDTNELLYAVYDSNWNLLFTRDVELPATLTYKVEEKLLTGYTYNFVFWAQKEGTYTPVWGTVGQPSEPYVTIDYVNANDDSRDAFFGQIEVTVEGTTNKSVELKRPFAQINHGTNDLVKAAEAGFNTAALTTSLKVSAYNTLYLNGGAVDGLTEVTFVAAPRDAEMTTLNTDYDWISMNYVLWTAEESSLGECTLTMTDGAKTIGVKYPQAPARRNYRTNLLGALLTDSANVDVEVKPGTDGDLGVEVPIYKTVSNATELQSAINNAIVGEITTITLDEDIDLYETRSGVGYITRVENGSSIVIDGAEHTLKGSIRIIGQSSEGVETTVIRNINFTTDSTELDFISSTDFGLGNNNWRYANNVIVENCTFTAAVSADPKVVGVRFNKAYNIVVKKCEGTNLHSLCQFQSNDTNITLNDLKAVNCKNGISLGNTKHVDIDGLSITATEYGIRADGDALQSGQRVGLEAKNATISAKQPIVIRKVTTGYDVVLGENVVLTPTEGIYQVVFTTGSDDAAYVAPAIDKYTFESVNDFMVFPIATNAAGLKAAIEAGATIVAIKGEIDLADVTLSGYNGTIVGVDDTAVLNTRNFTPGSNEAYQLRSQNLTLKKLTVKVPTEDGYYLQSGFVGTGTIVCEECDFEGQVTLNGNGTWTFNDCDFVSTEEGAYSSFVYGVTKATFNRCNFSGVDRAAKVYGEGAVLDVEYNTCTYTSSTLNKNGVEIDATYSTTTVALNSCQQTAMAGLYALKGTKGTVYVDGLKIIADGVSLDENGVYLITKAAGLTWFSDQMNNKKNTFSGKTIKVVNDIDMAGVTYYGGSIKSYPSYCFKGTFDGCEKVISNLTITVENDIDGAAALIPTLAGDGTTIKNVTLKNVNISSSHYAGAIWGYTTSDNCLISVTNCHVEGGTITGNIYNGDNGDKVGGIGGIFYQGTVSGCSVKSVTISGYRDTAGLVGWAADSRAKVLNNSIENITINVNDTNNYKKYTNRAAYDVNSYVGEGGNVAKVEGNTGEATINWGSISE